MKKWMLKRTSILFIMVIFLLTVFSMAGLTVKVQAASDFVLTHSCTDTLGEGDEFELPLKLRNLSSGAISDIELDFSSSSIAGLRSGNTIYAASGITVAANTEADIGLIPMRFTGDGSNSIMPVMVTYTLGGIEKSATVNLSLLTDEPEDPEPEDPFVPEEHKPSIKASLVGYDVVWAGSTATVHISLKNVSTGVGAKNISFVSPDFDEDSPFVYSKAITEMPIENLKAGGSADLDISVDVSKFAVAGTHPFTFKISYYNAWNVEFTQEYTVYLKVTNSLSNASLIFKRQKGGVSRLQPEEHSVFLWR
jgi:hypothetical protein